jgi:hypothetical protein
MKVKIIDVAAGDAYHSDRNAIVGKIGNITRDGGSLPGYVSGKFVANRTITLKSGWRQKVFTFFAVKTEDVK